ncbi:MAG TPA: DegT/DnrJ/EryC1/StrS family aminotransferase, partial [Thermoanaerobaculia bacterium]|nr:DegT/DnrJ/EryC1/StrS family aminotransferase [Thermoanaerobaculia bacterium]
MWDEAEEQAVLAALRGGEWGGFPMPNRHAARFADTFARFHDCDYGLCVANGTVSLELALEAAGVEPGAEVVVPAYTFEATAAAVLFAGCVPVFADVLPDTYCLDPAALEAVATPRTQAVVPVHLAMRFADLDRIGEIAARHGLAVIEDCAHAHGGQWRGRGAGSWGVAGSFSFQSSKLMTAGEGGIVVTRDAAVLDRLFALANCGRQRPGRRADTPVVGHNYRMTDLQAAILEVQLSRLEQQHELRN